MHSAIHFASGKPTSNKNRQNIPVNQNSRSDNATSGRVHQTHQSNLSAHGDCRNPNSNKRSLSQVQSALNEPKNRTKIRTSKKTHTLDPPMLELSREDAFEMAKQMQFQQQLKQISQSPELFDKLKDLLVNKNQEQLSEPKILTKKQEDELNSISEKHSPLLARQLEDFFFLKNHSGSGEKKQVDQLIEYARKRIHEIQETQSDTPSDMSTTSDSDHLEITDDILQQLLSSWPQEGSEPMDIDPESMGSNNESLCEDFTEESITSLLGDILYLAHNDISQALNCIDFESIDETQEKVREAFSQQLCQQLSFIDSQVEKHQHIPLQSIDKSHCQLLSVGLAKALLQPTGRINFGMIDSMIEVAIPAKFERTRALDNILYQLGQLGLRPELHNRFDKITKPHSPELPSNALIRETLQLPNKETITDQHAKITALSALLGHFRQGKQGTCFATAPLMETFYKDLTQTVEDFTELLRDGELNRQVFKENRSLPFQCKMTNEALDLKITIDNQARVRSTEVYHYNAEQNARSTRPGSHAYLYHAPGVIAAARALDLLDSDSNDSNAMDTNLDSACNIVLQAVQRLGNDFVVADLLSTMATIALEKQQSRPHQLRSQQPESFESLKHKAYYAFGSQTSHPLHRAWEHTAASSVYYMSTQYGMPNWTWQSIDASIGHSPKGSGASVAKKMRTLLDDMFLPMIHRMGYRYNPNFDDHLNFIDGKNYGNRQTNYYGYELVDKGLPEDFEYSQDTLKALKNETSRMPIFSFQEYAPASQWKLIDSGESFQRFVASVLQETYDHMKPYLSTLNGEQAKDWDTAKNILLKRIQSPHFINKVIDNLHGKESTQAKERKTNPFNMTARPWSFRMGGDPDAVMSATNGLDVNPVRNKHFIGTPKEILTHLINWMKERSDTIKQSMAAPNYATTICSTCHAFLLRPNEASFKKAWSSDNDTASYLQEHIINPGQSIANSRANLRLRKSLSEYLLSNLWVSASDEKNDLERQQLSAEGKMYFDELIQTLPNSLNGHSFQKALFNTVCQARARDSHINTRYPYWERRFKTVLTNKFNQLVNKDGHLEQDAKTALIDFCRNRVDQMALTQWEIDQLQSKLESIPSGLSLKDYRSALLGAATKTHHAYLGAAESSSHWANCLTPAIDQKLFELLPTTQQKTLRDSAIVFADTNWCDKEQGLNDYYFAFMVNPGTAQIEMHITIPGNDTITFMNQHGWFDSDYGVTWLRPDTYLRYGHQPEMNLEELQA